MNWNQQIFRRNLNELKLFLSPVLAVLGRSERRVAATRYVQGLLMPGQRKSIEPMAARLGVDSQGLQQFIADSPWDEVAVWRVIRKEIIPSWEPLQAWIIDETGWVKQGSSSVGVAHQYCGSVGKQANCQVSVELVVSDGEMVAPAAGRLYLPESWVQDRVRCKEAGVPADLPFKTKTRIALDLIDQALGDGVAAAPVLADSAYGDSSEFRQGLRERSIEFFLQVSASSHKAWTKPPALVKKLKRSHPDANAPAAQTLETIAHEFSDQQWHPVRWKAADRSTRKTRLAWVEVYLAHGLRQGEGTLERTWLIVDWPEGDPQPYHCFMADLKRPLTTARALQLSRGRWMIEQYFQRGKDDLGLDHYEGRSWRGFHHHLAISAIAYLFVLSVHLRAKKNFWVDVGDSAEGDPAVFGEIDRVLLLLRHEI
jgi:SRSO17 transposase